MWESVWVGLSFSLGLFYANAGEWVIHRYLLHGSGKHKDSFWNFHWGEHHRNCRKHAHVDPDYQRSIFGLHAQGKEAFGILLLLLLHVPLLWVLPYFALAVFFSGANYMRVHKRSHQDTQWGRKYLPWHYDHHMGKDQDQNWCVSWPVFDWIMGTRVPYAGTAAESQDLARAARRLQPRVEVTEVPHPSTPPPPSGTGGDQPML
ncbi:MAG: sterol desaturase family protein [Myxococcales bacterium]|nr:sterol desaturase family protein [Myxococcales bacterium]